MRIQIPHRLSRGHYLNNESSSFWHKPDRGMPSLSEEEAKR